MNACLENADVQEIGKSALDDFDESVSNLSKELCAPFFQQASRLESKLVTIFQFVAKAARSEPDMKKVSSLWGSMVHLCQDAEIKVSKLSEAHPDCGADYFFDRLTHLKSKCKRLQLMHS